MCNPGIRFVESGVGRGEIRLDDLIAFRGEMAGTPRLGNYSSRGKFGVHHYIYPSHLVNPIDSNESFHCNAIASIRVERKNFVVNLG